MSSPLPRPHTLRHSALTLALRSLLLGCAVLAPTLSSVSVQAATLDTRRYAIPAGPLETSLKHFAQTAGITLPFDPALVQGKQAPALRGEFAIEDGLHTLLAGSGLGSAQASGGHWLLFPVTDQNAALELPTSLVNGRSLGATTEHSGSYTTGVSSSATRMSLSLRETPQSVSVVTRQQMDDQGLQSISEVLRQAPGITVNQENSEGYSFYSRGFEIQNFQYDGIPSLSSDGGTLRDNYSIGNSLIYDRVEILKGATGLVNGVGYPSGVINMVRKRPTAKFQGHVALGAGSWDRYRSEVDVSGPLNDSGALRGRAVVGAESHDSFIDYQDGEQYVFYGIVEADVSSDTTVAVGYDLQKNHNNGTTTGALPAFFSDGRQTHFSRSTNAGDRWAYRNHDTQRAFAEVTHALPHDWSLQAVLSARQYRSRELIAGMTSVPVDARDNSVTHGFFGGGASKFDTDSNEETLDLYAKGPFSLFGRSHELVLGYSYGQTSAQSKRADGTTDSRIDDAFNWNNNATQPSRYDWWSTFDVEARQQIAYAATVLKPTDRLSVILGARVNDYRWAMDTINANGFASHPRTTVSGELIPYAGVTFDLDPQHSLYASYTDVFKPQAYSFDASDRQLDPLTGESYEVGVKGEYFDGGLNASVALFELHQDNVAEASGTRPSGGIAYRAVQGVKTRGIELEMAGQLAERLQVQAGYVFQESHDGEGQRAATTQPQHLLKLAGTYQLSGALERLTVGGNLQWQSATFFSPEEWYRVAENPKFTQQAYTVVGVMSRYAFSEQLTGTLHLNNLFDKTYYSGIGNYETVYYGNPRNLMATLKYSF